MKLVFVNKGEGMEIELFAENQNKWCMLAKVNPNMCMVKHLKKSG